MCVCARVCLCVTVFTNDGGACVLYVRVRAFVCVRVYVCVRACVYVSLCDTFTNDGVSNIESV
jgi:hypothetical protein